MAAVLQPMPSHGDLFPSKMPDSVLAECVLAAVRDPAVGEAGLLQSMNTPAAEAGSRSPSNGGSLGHPVICSRPCLYFAVGDCANGDSCQFCHMPHPKRAPHLDKQHRTKLQNLAPETQRAWLLSIVRAKVAALDNSAETQAVIEDLTRACGVSELCLPDPANMVRADRMLLAATSSLNLRALLVYLRKNLEEMQPSPGFDVETIIKHCQHLVHARG